MARVDYVQEETLSDWLAETRYCHEITGRSSRLLFRVKGGLLIGLGAYGK